MSEAGCVVDKYYQGWNTGNLDAMAELLAKNLKFRGPMEQHDSAEAFMASCRKMAENEMFADVKVRPHARLIQGDEVCCLYEFESGAKERKTVPVAEYFKVVGGKIAEIRLYFDGRAYQ